MLLLGSQQPFARGGNRLCFVHPHNPQWCVKVRRPDFTLADYRRKKGFPRNLRPLSSFDDNLEESRVIETLRQRCGEDIHHHIYRCYGFTDTDFGRGLMTELLRDGDGRVSVSLKQDIWERGYPEETRQAVEALTSFWLHYLVPSRELLTHNVVVQRDTQGQIQRLVVIDGLGAPFAVPFYWLPKAIRRKKVAQRIERFHQRIEKFIHQCSEGRQPSAVGILRYRTLEPSHNNGVVTNDMTSPQDKV
nr:YrbL family protein [uncultured Desulfuromonas sp.]